MAGYSFGGLIHEIPGLGIDKFNTGASVFLLTHSHSDHLAGLDNLSFGGIVYCSKATKELLATDKGLHQNIHRVKGLDLDRQYDIEVQNQTIKLTLIDAYHCPGAVLFLIETGTVSILCTGDLRAEKWWLDSIGKNPYLFPYTTNLKTLDTIYLDTTFGYRGEPYIEMPSNNDGIRVAILLLDAYPKDDPELEFWFVDTVLGFEEAWVQIAKSFGGRIQLQDKKLIRRMECLGGVYEDIMQSMDSSQRLEVPSPPIFHVGRPSNHHSIFPIRIKQCIDFNAVDFTGVFCPILLDCLDEEEISKSMELLHTTSLGHEVYRFRGRTWILPLNSRELLPTEIKLIFSRHSSYSECVELVSKFRPRQVYPCTDSRNMWQRGFQMLRVFGKWCETKVQPPTPQQFRYDTERLIEWGPPAAGIQERQVKCIDRWDLESCKKEMQIVQEIINDPFPLHIRGQHWTSKFGNPHYSEDDRKVNFARKKDFQLQNIVIGRGERAYRRIIEDLQNVYRNVNLDKGKDYITQEAENIDVDIHEVDYDVKVAKLGGLDNYNYDKSSKSSNSSNSSSCDYLQDDTDVDDEDDEYQDVNNGGILPPSQGIMVGSLTLKRRATFSAGPLLQRRRTNEISFSDTCKILSTFGSMETSFSIQFEESRTKETQEIKPETEKVIEKVSETLRENSITWIGMGLKSIQRANLS